MSKNQNRKLQDEEGVILTDEDKKREFLDRCEATASKLFEKRRIEENKAYHKHKNFVIRW